VPILKSLRALSRITSFDHISTTNRLVVSSMIYDTNFSLVDLNNTNVDDPENIICAFSHEDTPLKMALHLFLYLVIREIPPYSQLYLHLVQRLCAAIELHGGGWWEATEERKIWLLWMLFMGGAAAAGEQERWWFVIKMSILCRELAIWSQDDLKSTLKRVLWQDAWGDGHCASLWNDLGIVGERVGGSLNPHLLELRPRNLEI
jgi:hypothetical protein